MPLLANNHACTALAGQALNYFFMKKIIFILLFATAGFTACKKEFAETKTATETSLTNAINAPVTCTGNTWGDQQLYKGSISNKPLTYNNKAYVFDFIKDKVFIYNGTSWDSISMFIPFNKNPDFVFTIGNKGYLGHIPEWGPDPRDVAWFWQYDFVAKTWSSKATYPGLSNHPPSTFTIGNKGYAVGGAYYSFSSSLIYHSIKETWEYNQATNSWTQKADLPFIGIYAATGFSIGNKGYIVNGAFWTGVSNPTIYLSDLYEYNPATNAWSFKTPFPGAKRIHTNVFVIGQAAYAGGGLNSNNIEKSDYYKYSPATNAWVSVANFPNPHTLFNNCFSINSLGYVPYSKTGSTQLQMLKYTPKTCTLQGTSQ